jgi:hypothetical protein
MDELRPRKFFPCQSVFEKYVWCPLQGDTPAEHAKAWTPNGPTIAPEGKWIFQTRSRILVRAGQKSLGGSAERECLVERIPCSAALQHRIVREHAAQRHRACYITVLA